MLNKYAQAPNNWLVCSKKYQAGFPQCSTDSSDELTVNRQLEPPSHVHTRTFTRAPIFLCVWGHVGSNRRQVTKQPEVEFQDLRGLFEVERPTGS